MVTTSKIEEKVKIAGFVQKEAGNFFEADHLYGDVDMYRVVKEFVKMMQGTKTPLTMRPDHGHQMLGDLNSVTYPGYSAIGRIKGLAELRGLEEGIVRGADS